MQDLVLSDSKIVDKIFCLTGADLGPGHAGRVRGHRLNLLDEAEHRVHNAMATGSRARGDAHCLVPETREGIMGIIRLHVC